MTNRRWNYLRMGVGLVIAIIMLSVYASIGTPRAVKPANSQESAGVAAPVSLALPPPPTVLAAALGGAGVVVSWVAHGEARLEPCGCVAGMHGGLARRAALLSRVPASRALHLECGGWSGGSVDHQVIRAQAYLEALAAAGVAAVGVGVAEASLFPGAADLPGSSAVGLPGSSPARDSPAGDRLRPLISAGPPVVCCNLPGFTGSVQVERQGQAFVITSVVPAAIAGAEDPAEAVRRLLPVPAGAKLIVLADLDRAGLVALAESVPGIALVVGGAVDQPTPQPLTAGAARVVHVANHGKTLGWWPWGGADCAFELITEAVPDHPMIRARIAAYQRRLATLDLAVDHPLAGRGASLIGDDACMGCHANAAAIHGVSRHANAYASLVKKQYQYDPECLRCHVTGLGASGGFSRRDPVAFARVGCESCHGPGSLHAAERAAGRPATGSLVPVTPATCVQCHDPENSPKFSYPTYWPRIAHGF